MEFLLILQVVIYLSDCCKKISTLALRNFITLKIVNKNLAIYA